MCSLLGRIAAQVPRSRAPPASTTARLRAPLRPLPHRYISPVKATDSSTSEHRLADNCLCGDRILKGDCAPQFVVGVEAIDDAKHRLHSGYVGFAFLNGIEACQVRKSVEVDRTGEPVELDLPEQFDRLERMHGSNH